MIDRPPRRPRRLSEGDLVALVAPSGWVPPERAQAAVDVLTGWGLGIRLGKHALGRHTYLSGTDEQRLADFNDALRSPEVRGVLCLRGGYGAQRIADQIDLTAAHDDPKLVLGFSDVTALHLALWAGAGLPTVHGPTVTQFDRGAASLTATAARHALMSGEPVTVTAADEDGTRGLRVSGRAEGVLLGGNLTLLATSVGTQFRPDLRGAILLLEDVHEEPYEIDRYLVQLTRAGWLGGVAGVAVGQFTDCGTADVRQPSVVEVLAERLTPLGVPILGGLPIGHGDQQVAVGLGVPAVLDATAGTLVVEPVGR
ncbi:MAG TPA: LD-carboxypeptidase [Actinoplanes sp.]